MDSSLQSQSTFSNVKQDLPVKGLAESLAGYLQIQDDDHQKQSKVTSPDKDEREQQQPNEEDDEEEDIMDEILEMSGYKKTEILHSPIIYLPADYKLVSAMKGSREKEGKSSTEKVRVRWATDVYDPPPTTAERFAKSKARLQKTETPKKSGQSKQQKWGGKPSAAGGRGGGGGKGKDKKAVRRYAGSSRKCFDALDQDETLVD